MNNQPYISIIIPIHDMQGGADFLWRSINALTEQTFQDFEIIITKDGKMAENTNAGIKRARGKLIKILYLDDYLSGEHSLQLMADAFTDDMTWMIVGSNDNVHPQWTDDIETGNNKLGSPSALMMRTSDAFFFDENMSWLLDIDLYKRLYHFCGEPKILNGNLVTIGKHAGQMTHILTDEQKLAEHEYITKKYDK